MKPLAELNFYTGYFLTSKGTLHTYLPVYDKLFTPFRDKKINIFEVGYLFGGSAKLMELYFPKAIIKTIDVTTTFPYSWCKEAEARGETTNIEMGSRTSMELKDSLTLTPDYFTDFVPDIAIDDGGHSLESQLHFVKTVYPVLREGGLLIVEDIQDYDNQKEEFEKLGYKFYTIDKRNETGRYDDVLLIYKK